MAITRLAVVVGLGLVGSLSPLAAQVGSPVDRELANAGLEYRRTGSARTIKRGAAVVYPYGHTQPVLTCSVLSACVIYLEPGEEPLDRAGGDLSRWDVSLMRGPQQALVAVKPQDCNLTTNLVLSTDRRVYDILLDSPKCGKAAEDGNPKLPYVRELRFWYPDDLVKQFAVDEARGAARRAAEIPVAAAVMDPTGMAFDYRWRRDKGFPWVPDAVFDDGVHTFLKLPDVARHSDRPVLYELAGDGTLNILNYANRDGYFVVDRVLVRGVLVIGTGSGKGMRLLIEKGGRS